MARKDKPAYIDFFFSSGRQKASPSIQKIRPDSNRKPGLRLINTRTSGTTTPQLAQKLVFCNSDLDKSITVCKMESEGFPQNLFGFGKICS